MAGGEREEGEELGAWVIDCQCRVQLWKKEKVFVWLTNLLLESGSSTPKVARRNFGSESSIREVFIQDVTQEQSSLAMEPQWIMLNTSQSCTVLEVLSLD